MRIGSEKKLCDDKIYEMNVAANLNKSIGTSNYVFEKYYRTLDVPYTKSFLAHYPMVKGPYDKHV